MAPSHISKQRNPAVLVTDARERAPPPFSRPNAGARQSSRFITVDSVLGYHSDIPSMRARATGTSNSGTGSLVSRPRAPRTPSGRPAEPKLAGRMVPQHLPARSTKVSEKLVLLPETEPDEEDNNDNAGAAAAKKLAAKAAQAEKADYDDDNDASPLRDDEEALRSPGVGKSYAERLPKARRAEKLARVTAYCTAQAYKLTGTASFLRETHGARTKLYDDCLYVVYHLPLLPGVEGYRVRSSPVLKGRGGRAVVEEEIERSEGRDYGEGYFEEERFEVRGHGHAGEGEGEGEGGRGGESPLGESSTPPSEERAEGEDADRGGISSKVGGESTGGAGGNGTAKHLRYAEMFVFSYGVVVFWNFTERQEKDVLADLTFSKSERGIPLVTRPQREEDFETEEFYFEYSPNTPRPRVFNDMITLRSGDHMIKLAMSHAIAQSTKLSFFEEGMARQMVEAQHVPKRLALTGKLGMKREEVIKILGALFKSRVDVNLSSNMLDVPNFFWESEPTLHPLYFAVREYLEIKPRIQVLNERCRVFLDLAEILSDSIADNKMSRLTWIIIILIILSIAVTCSEVFLRFAILNKERSHLGTTNLPLSMPVIPVPDLGMSSNMEMPLLHEGLL